jgi:hypothetical protein
MVMARSLGLGEVEWHRYHNKLNRQRFALESVRSLEKQKVPKKPMGEPEKEKDTLKDGPRIALEG